MAENTDNPTIAVDNPEDALASFHTALKGLSEKNQFFQQQLSDFESISAQGRKRIADVTAEVTAEIEAALIPVTDAAEDYNLDRARVIEIGLTTSKFLDMQHLNKARLPKL